MRTFVDTWDAEDNPIDINDYRVCLKCRVAWIDIDIETMTPYEQEVRRA